MGIMYFNIVSYTNWSVNVINTGFCSLTQVYVLIRYTEVELLGQGINFMYWQLFLNFWETAAIFFPTSIVLLIVPLLLPGEAVWETSVGHGLPISLPNKNS